MIRVRVSGPTFRTFFMVRVRVRVISSCDVMLNMFIAVRIKLQTVVWKFSPTKLNRPKIYDTMIVQ